MKTYYEKLKDLREDHDLKQNDIAKLLNVTQTNYSKYERGERKITIEQLKILCEFYKVSADYIIGIKYQ